MSEHLIKRTWIGKFFDVGENGNEEPIGFRLDVEMAENMTFDGKMWEEEFYPKTKLLIDVKGYIENDHISFVKSYPCLYDIDENNQVVIDLNQKGHEVVYQGEWIESRGVWSGFWEIKGAVVFEARDYYEEIIYQGPFEMSILKDLE